MQQHIVSLPVIWFAALVLATLLCGSAARAKLLDQILRGYEIAANQGIPLNLKGKDWATVGLGSYLVNTTGCNDCHTHPNWTTTGNPYNGEPEQINTAEYLSGGRVFTTPAGMFTSANITPDKRDRPAGLTLAGFLEVMHTGHDPRDPPGDLLQVMSWPLYRWKTDSDLIAIYTYLQAIPSLPDNSNPGP
ncbi:MAG: hypothetical protein JO110_09215 [Acetobacteraceae bacterium]|nr:hypothetical protein [Acetobacteraceae bacterium]